MHINKNHKASAVKVMMVTPIMLSLMVSGQSFASEPRQSVASMVQDFIQTAQGRQNDERSRFGQTIFASVQELLQPKNISQNNNTLFASTQAINITDTNSKESGIDPSVFFQDIENHEYSQSISILASHDVFKKNDKFFPHNYVRLNDVSKLIINSYRITVGLGPIEATPRQFVQTAFDEGFLTNIISHVDDKTMEKVVTYGEMQTIVDNIHRQYPNISRVVDISEPKADILLKGAMSEYIVQAFNVPLHMVNYNRARYSHIIDSKHYDAMRTLIENNIISRITNHSQYVSRADFIQQVVKAYALDKKVVIQNTTHNISDLDNQNTGSMLIVYAHDQGRLDYILIQTKGQTFIDPDAKITIDEVYEILSSITDKQFITGIIQADTPMPQDQIAQAIVDAFDIKPKPEPTFNPIQNSTTPRLSLVQRVRHIFTQL